MIVDQVVPLTLEFLMREMRELYNKIAWLLSESKITFTWELDLLFARDCTHSWFHFNKPCNSDDPFISSMINSLDLIELYLLLASKEELFKCALHINFKVFGCIRMCLYYTSISTDLFKSSYLISFIIKGDCEWVASAEELLEDLIDVP